MPRNPRRGRDRAAGRRAPRARLARARGGGLAARGRVRAQHGERTRPARPQRRRGGKGRRAMRSATSSSASSTSGASTAAECSSTRARHIRDSRARRLGRRAHLPPPSGRERPPCGPRSSTARYLFSGRALHLAGALVMHELDGEPAASAARRGPDARARDERRHRLRRDRRLGARPPCLPHADLFTPSLAEARALSGEEEPAAAAAWLRERGAAHGRRSPRGAEGCYAAGDGFEGPVEPFAVARGGRHGLGRRLRRRPALRHPRRLAARATPPGCANALGALATTAVGADEGMPPLEEALAFAGLLDG